jgi:biopolymer transport protein ExbD
MAAKIGGPGGRKPQLRQNAEINVTPFVDIMLVLLIVMMVAVPAATMAIKVDLPPIPVSANGQPPTFVSLQQEGRMLIMHAGGQQPTSLARLSADLAADLGPDARSKSILVRADRSVRYGDFMAVVDQLQSDGYFKVSLITEDRPLQAGA